MNSNFYLKKKLHINPNLNSTKAIRVICDGKFKKYNTKKLNKKTNQSYKKEQKSRERERERERERILTIFVWKKYGLNGINDIKFIRNKMEEKKSQNIRKKK